MSTYLPAITSVPRDVEILTFQDVVERVLDLFSLDRENARNVRRARQAVSNAVRDVSQIHRWSCYRRMWVLTASAYFNTGTVAVSNSTRIATFSSTLPSWAAYGTLQILGTAEDGPEYEVESRLSDTTLLLRSESNVGADVAATSSYRLVRRYYPVPVDLKEILSFRDVDNEINLVPFTAPEMADRRVYANREPDVPRMFQVRGYANSLTSRIVELSPPPDSAHVYHVPYIAQARPLHTDYFETKATVAADSTTVTSSETLPQNIVGSVVRFSDDTGYPTSHLGSVDGTDNPWKVQRVVASRASDTTFTIDAVTGEAFSGVGAVISDPVDIIPSVMLSAILAEAEQQFAFSIQAEGEMLGRLRTKARDKLRECIEADHPGSALIRGGSLDSWPVVDYGATYTEGTNYPS